MDSHTLSKLESILKKEGELRKRRSYGPYPLKGLNPSNISAKVVKYRIAEKMARRDRGA